MAPRKAPSRTTRRRVSTVPPATLAAAIRRGMRLGPQSFNYFYQEGGGSCALGAAGEACFPNIRREMQGLAWRLQALYPILATRHSCPIETCPQRHFPLGLWNLIAHLNDDHRWSRGVIAAFVQAIESK